MSVGTCSHVIKATGAAWCWGNNNTGQCGNNTAANSYSSPVAVVGSHSFIQIAQGRQTSWALKDSGECWGWGSNSGTMAGMIGDNTVTNRSSPVQVVGSHSFISIAGAENWAMGLKVTGECWTWGQNTNADYATSGQLGNNSITATSSPVAVVGSHSFITIRGGETHAAALKIDGSVWCWGGNDSGQLGDNSITNRSSPVAVVGSHSFISISAGFSQTMAMKSDGSVWCWGDNVSGQLGNNSITNTSSPVAVVGSHSFIDISCGGPVEGANTIGALKADGSVWCWGSNERGQVGNNTKGNSYSSPVQVVGSHSFTLLTAGSGFMMAFKPDGSCWGWGSDNDGRLGNNNAGVSYSSPVTVVGSHSFLCIWDRRLHMVYGDDGTKWQRVAYGYVDDGSAWKRIMDINVQVAGAWKKAT